MAFWNFTIDDTSPYLAYTPYADGSGVMNGWQTWYSESGYNTAPGESSRGDSKHITSLRNANVSFEFYGTGISLFGATNTSFDVTVDNVSRTSVNSTTTPLLFSDHSLNAGTHSITLTVKPSNSAQLVFDSAVVSLALDSDENPPSPIFYDSFNTTFLLYSGAWTARTIEGVPNTTVSAPFQETTANGASVSWSFTGATAVAVKGLADWGNGMYSVSMDGSASTFNGSSVWIVPDALLFFRAGLDPGAIHHVNVTNHEPRIFASTLAPSNASPKASSSVRVIIGPIAGVLVLLIISAYIWYRRRCRRRINKIAQPSKGFINGPRASIGKILGVGGVTPPYLSRSAYGSIIGSDTKLLSHIPGISPSVQSGSGSSALTSASAGGYWSSTSMLVLRPSDAFLDHSASTSDIDTPRSDPLGQTSPNTSHDYITMPSRKPLPMIPVPSYDAALQTAESVPIKAGIASDLLNPRPHSFESVPPQYEL